MQHVLTVTIQGPLGFSSGYVWWMSGEEVLLWSPDRAVMDDELLLRIDWARGAYSIKCVATVHSVLPVSSTSVKAGKALYATFELINPWDDGLLNEGLLKANPALKTRGWDHLPARLVTPRRKAESRLGRKLGLAPGASQEEPPEAEEPAEEPAKPAKEPPIDRLGILPPRPPARKLVSKKAAALRPAKEPDRVPPPARKFDPDDITPEHPEFEKRSETDELVPVLSSEGAEREFTTGSPASGSSGEKYVGYSTNGRGGQTPSGSGSTTSRLQALADKLRQRAARGGGFAKSADTPGGTRADGKKGLLRVSHFVPGPPHAMLLRVSDPAQLRRALVIGDNGFEIYLRRDPGIELGIELGDQVNVLLGMPDGTPLEFSGSVDRVKPRSLRLAVNIPDEFVISSMEMLIEETS